MTQAIIAAAITATIAAAWYMAKHSVGQRW